MTDAKPRHGRKVLPQRLVNGRPFLGAFFEGAEWL